MNGQKELIKSTTSSLAEILERVLDKGVVIAGDIRVEVAQVELLTIKIRLLIASVDKAREIGIDWWEHDRFLSSGEKPKRLITGNSRRIGAGSRRKKTSANKQKP